jgi:hypothetical protein
MMSLAYVLLSLCAGENAEAIDATGVPNATEWTPRCTASPDFRNDDLMALVVVVAVVTSGEETDVALLRITVAAKEVLVPTPVQFIRDKASCAEAFLELELRRDC